MDDLISRQAALDVLNELARDRFTIKDTFQIYLDALKDAVLKIRQMPTAEPKWIPCSERLPEEGEDVLWCTPSGYVCSGCVLLGRPMDDCGHQGNYIAWMPLPKPYEEESE